MSQSSAGFSDDDDWQDEVDSAPDAMPMQAEQRQSINLRSPDFQKDEPDDPVGESVEAAASFADLAPPQPQPASNATQNISSAFQRFRESEVSPARGFEQTYVKSRDRQEAGLMRYARSQGAQTETQPDGSQRLAQNSDGTPRLKPQKGQPYQRKDTGRWVLPVTNERGETAEHDLISERIASLDHTTGEYHITDQLGRKITVGNDPATLERQKRLAERQQLGLQDALDRQEIAKLNFDLTPKRRELGKFGGVPTTHEENIARLEEAAKGGDKYAIEDLKFGREQYNDWLSQNPDYLITKKAVEDGTAKIRAFQKSRLDRRDKALALASGAPGRVEAVDPAEIPQLYSALSDARAKAQTATDNGADATAFGQSITEIESRLHGATVAATQFAPQVQRTLMRLAAPQADADGLRAELVANPLVAASAAEIGRVLAPLYVAPERIEAARRFATQNGVNPRFAEVLMDQTVALHAARTDLRSVLTGGMITEDKARALASLGLLQSVPQPDGTTKAMITDDAAPLLPKMLREAIRRNPDRIVITPGEPGDMLQHLADAGRTRLAEAAETAGNMVAPATNDASPVAENGKQGHEAARPFMPDEPPFRVADGVMHFDPSRLSDGVVAAFKAGALSAEQVRVALPKARAAERAMQEQEALLQKHSGIADKLKAAGYGAGKGAAFLATAPYGAAAGAKLGALGGPAAPFTVPAGAIVGGLITGTAGSMAADKIVRKLGEYNATIKSFTDASDAHPFYDAAGNLVSFGIGGLPKTIANLSGDAAIRAASGASKGQIAKAIGYRVGGAAAANVAIDTAIKEGGVALGFSDEHMTLSDAAQSAAIGAFFAGHGIRFGNYTSEQVAQIVVKERLGQQLSANEAEVANAVKSKLTQMRANGELPQEPSASDVESVLRRTTAKQATQSGQPYGVTAAYVGSDSPGSPPARGQSSPQLPPSPSPETNPKTPAPSPDAPIPHSPSPESAPPDSALSQPKENAPNSLAGDTPRSIAGQPETPPPQREDEQLQPPAQETQAPDESEIRALQIERSAREKELAAASAEFKQPVASRIAEIDARIEQLQASATMEPPAMRPQSPLDQAAHQAATSPNNALREPTDAQKQAGNYKVGKVRIGSLDISVENPAGSVRSGKDKSGKEWQVEMKSHYGYVRRTTGADNDAVDVFVKQGTPTDWSGPVFVVNQVDPKTRSFDEAKAVIGVRNKAEAAREYQSNYAPGWKGFGGIAEFPNIETFRKWAEGRDSKKPAADFKPPIKFRKQTPEERAAELAERDALAAMNSRTYPTVASAAKHQVLTFVARYRNVFDRVVASRESNNSGGVGYSREDNSFSISWNEVVNSATLTYENAINGGANDAAARAQAQHKVSAMLDEELRHVADVRANGDTATSWMWEQLPDEVKDATKRIYSRDNPNADYSAMTGAHWGYEFKRMLAQHSEMGDISELAEMTREAVKKAVREGKAGWVKAVVENLRKIIEWLKGVAESSNVVRQLKALADEFNRLTEIPLANDLKESVNPSGQGKNSAAGKSKSSSSAQEQRDFSGTSQGNGGKNAHERASGGDTLAVASEGKGTAKKRRLSKAEREYQRELEAEQGAIADETMRSAGYVTLAEAVIAKGGLPSLGREKINPKSGMLEWMDSHKDAMNYRGELVRVLDALRTKNKAIKRHSERITISSVLSPTALSADDLANQFGFETPHDLIAALESELVTGKPQWINPDGPAANESGLPGADDDPRWIAASRAAMAEKAKGIPDRLRVIHGQILRGRDVETVAREQSLPVEQIERIFDRVTRAMAVELGNVKLTPGSQPVFILSASRAYHGTPHEVDRFSTEKIGTGEGAQVYGWGLYFAENPKVAEVYRSQLNPARPDRYDTAYAAAARSFIETNGSVTLGDMRKAYPRAETEALEYAMREARGHENGFTYTVALDVEPDELLDWDKPLSEQSEKVQQIFATQFPEVTERLGGGTAIGGARGEDAYRVIAGTRAFEGASQALNQTGLVGIRYLDHGSRDNGNGTYNYVIFDESKIKITHRNGEPVELGEAILSASRASKKQDAGDGDLFATPKDSPQRNALDTAALQDAPVRAQNLGKIWQRLTAKLTRGDTLTQGEQQTYLAAERELGQKYLVPMESVRSEAAPAESDTQQAQINRQLIGGEIESQADIFTGRPEPETSGQEMLFASRAADPNQRAFNFGVNSQPDELALERQRPQPVSEPAKSAAELARDNLGLATYIANQYRNIPRADFDDILGEARKALVRAARSFDTGHGKPFSAYAGTVIRNHLNGFYGKETKIATHETGSMDAPLGQDADSETLHDVTADSASPGVTQSIDQDETQAIVRQLVGELGDRARQIVELSMEGKPLREIGETVGLSHERVRTILDAAQQSLRRKLARLNLRHVDADGVLYASRASDSRKRKNDNLVQGAWLMKQAINEDKARTLEDVPHEKNIARMEAWRYNYPDADAAAKAYPLPLGFLEGNRLDESQIRGDNLGRSLAAFEERQGGQKARASDIEAFRAAVKPLVEEAKRTKRDFSEKLLELVGAQGGEHSVILAPGRVIKLTEPDSAGGVVKFNRDGEPGVFPGTVPEYVRQIEQNAALADDTQRIEGTMRHRDGSIRIVTSQKAACGVKPSYGEIEAAFRNNGFVPVEKERVLGQEGYEMWWHPESNIAVMDAKPDNLVKTGTGEIVPIDLKAFTPEGKALEWIKNHAITDDPKSNRGTLDPNDQNILRASPAAANRSTVAAPKPASIDSEGSSQYRSAMPQDEGAAAPQSSSSQDSPAPQGSHGRVLYRAADSPEAAAGAHFSENEEEAKAYQDNPGFGGKNIYRFNVDDSRVADVATLRDLATKLEPLLDEDQKEWADDQGGLFSAMRDYGFDHVFHALENSFGPRANKIDPIELLAKDHDWIRFTDDFPQGAKSWRYIGDKALSPENPESRAPEKGALFASPATAKSAAPVPKIDAPVQRILRGGRWLWEGTADVFERNGFPKLAEAVRRQFDEQHRRFGEAWKPIRDVLGTLKGLDLKTAKAEWESYFRHRENGRTAEAQATYTDASAGGRALIDAWKATAQIASKVLRDMGVEVKDGDHWRLIGQVKDYFPRKINQATMKVLSDRTKYPSEWDRLVQDLIANGNIENATEADRFLREDVFNAESDSDSYANIERARVAALPESWLEYAFDQVAPWYVAKYSQRAGQIAAYGQKHKPGGDLWQQEIEKLPSTPDYQYTRKFLDAAQKAAYFTKSNTELARVMKNLQAFATGAFLSNPYSAIRNLVSGTTQTAVQYGGLETLKSTFEAMTSSLAKAEAHDLGVLRDDLIAMMMEGRDDTTVNQKLRKAASFGLSHTGFNAAETVVRTAGVLAAKHFIRKAEAALRDAPGSHRALKTEAFLRRHNVDPEKIAAGDFEERARFIRASVRETQGGYAFDQTPLVMSDPVMGFLTQFQKWGVQMTRFFVRHGINPAVFGEKVTRADGSTVNVRSFRPLLYMGAFALGGGELLFLLKELFTDRDRPDASLEEIGHALEQNEAEGVRQALSRMFSDVLNAGTFGIISDYLGGLREFSTRSRFKHPFNPPGIQAANNIANLIVAGKQQGTLTYRDVMGAIETQFPGVKFGRQVTNKLTGDTLQQARNTQATARAAGMRMAKELGLDVQAPFNSETPVKTPKSPLYGQLNDALLSGDVAAARETVREIERGAKSPAERDQLRAGLKASIGQKQPIKVGGIAGSEQREAFLGWARTRLGADDYRKIVELDRRYWQTALALGISRPQPKKKGSPLPTRPPMLGNGRKPEPLASRF